MPRRTFRWDYALMIAGAVISVLALVWMVTANPISGQTVTVVGGEIRQGERGRQDFGGVEVGIPAGPLRALVEVASRHGDADDDNSARPWVAVTFGRSLDHRGLRIGPYAGGYLSPVDDYRVWRWLVGPRLDIRLGGSWGLHLSHYWRSEGRTAGTLRPWTARTSLRLDLRVYGS